MCTEFGVARRGAVFIFELFLGSNESQLPLQQVHCFSHRDPHSQAKATRASCVLTFPPLTFLGFTLYLSVLQPLTVD